MTKLSSSDVDRLVEILAEQAATTPGAGSGLYFVNLVDRADVPRVWTFQIAGTWSGDVAIDARNLLRWAEAKGVNQQDARFTTLGSILTAALPGLGLDRAATVVATISARGLYRDKRLVRNLQTAYGVPVAPNAEPFPQPDGLAWRAEPAEPTAAEDDTELQGIFQRDPDYLDIGFLRAAITRSATVCRIETSDGRPVGSGFLVGPDLVITNNHVLEPPRSPARDAAKLVARFGALSPALPPAVPERAVPVAPEEPVVRSSPTDALDFALLRLSAPIGDVEPLLPADGARPEPGGSIHILQHPGGETMKLALSVDGVRKVFDGPHVVHYRSRTAGGSSGSPCYDDDWRLVAVHRAEKSRPTGSIREGILFSAVLEEIGDEIVM